MDPLVICLIVLIVVTVALSGLFGYRLASESIARDGRRDPIEEPTTKYAEVESCEGTVYFRTPAGNWQRDDDGIQRPWDHLGVRRVLSEGVTP